MLEYTSLSDTHCVLAPKGEPYTFTGSRNLAGCLNIVDLVKNISAFYSHMCTKSGSHFVKCARRFVLAWFHFEAASIVLAKRRVSTLNWLALFRQIGMQDMLTCREQVRRGR